MLLKWVFIFLSLQASGHEGHDHGSTGESEELARNLYEKAVRLSPEIMETAISSIAHPHIKTGGKTIYLNSSPEILGPKALSHPLFLKTLFLDSAFMELLTGYLKLYHKEEAAYCPCNTSPEELAQQAQDQIAASFTQSKLTKPSQAWLKGIVITGFDKLEKYGKVAFVLQIVAEVAETILFKGNHLLCKANNALVLLIVRPAQAYTRVLGHSQTLNQSRLIKVSQRILRDFAMRGAHRRARFYLESARIEIDQLLTVNEEGPGDKRLEWAQEVSKKVTPLIDKIKILDRQLENPELSDRKIKKLLKKRKKLAEKISSLTELDKKIYRGNRRYFWLRSSKGKPGYLKGQSFPDETFSSNWLWMMGASENIVRRSFFEKIKEQAPHKTTQTFIPYEAASHHEAVQIPFLPVLKEDGIRKGLAEEFSEKLQLRGLISNGEEHIKYTERILGDIEKIFDPSLSVVEKDILISFIKETLAEFFGEHYLNIVYNQLRDNELQVKLRRLLSRFTYHVYDYIDFLSTVALIKNEQVLFSYKYESMEMLLKLLEYLIEIPEIATTSGSKAEVLARLDANITKIQAFKPWQEKRTAFRFWGSGFPIFGSGLPLCQDLVRKAK